MILTSDGTIMTFPIIAITDDRLSALIAMR